MKSGIIALALGLSVCVVPRASTPSGSPASREVIPQRRLGLFHRDAHVTAAARRALFTEAGIPKSDRKYYRVDHKVPLELGGSKDYTNLQLQTKPEAKAKERVEHYLIEKVRRGDMTVAEAREKAVDWKHVNRY